MTELEELMAKGYTRDEALRIINEGGVDPSIQDQANYRDFERAKQALGQETASQLGFMQDSYDYNRPDWADEPIQGSAVPYFRNPEYDMVPGGAEQPQYEGGDMAGQDAELGDEDVYAMNQPQAGMQRGAPYMGRPQPTQYNTQPEEPMDDKTRYQRDLIQAQMDASSSVKDANNISRYNFNYSDYTPLSTGESVFKSVLTYGLAYLASGGDAEQALRTSLDYTNTRINREHRYSQIQSLEEQGYNPKDIDAFVQTGDYNMLVKNKRSWQNAGGGALWRESPTGDVEWMTAPRGAQVEKPMTEYQRRSLELQERRLNQSGAGGMGNIRKPMPEYDLEGRYTGTRDLSTGEFYPAPSGAGGYKTPAEAAKAKEKQQEKVAMSENYRSAMNDLDTLANFKDEDIEPFVNITGGIGKPGIGGEYTTRDLPIINTEDTRKAFELAQRINSQMENMGIAEAKAMGASGINTESEAQRFAKSMPRIDFSSPKAMRASVGRVKDYITRYNQSRGINVGTQPSGQAPTRQQAQAPAAQKGEDLQIIESKVINGTVFVKKSNGKWYKQ